MSHKQKKGLLRIGIGIAIYLMVILYAQFGWFPKGHEEFCTFLIFLIPYTIAGRDVIQSALINIFHGQIFDENFLMTIATMGAFFIGEYVEAVAVMIFYLIGEWFQSYAVNRSRKSIAELMNIRPDYANVQKAGKLIQVDPDDVAIGTVIIVKPGERIPIDGVVVSGSSFLDTSALTGETVPRKVKTGANVISGCINQTEAIEIKTTREFRESTVSQILDLVENASSKKAKTENFITRFARVYTPIVVFSALILAIVPPIVTGQSPGIWLSRALIFLVISCPCALVISVPLSFFGGIGGASRCGILIKGSNYLEVLSNVDTIVFDKTGTLTKGTFGVVKCEPAGITETELLYWAALAEGYSTHPIAQSIKNSSLNYLNLAKTTSTKEVAGCGICAVVSKKEVLVGNEKLMRQYAVSYRPAKETGTIIYVAIDRVYAGYILIADEIKEGAREAIDALKEAGIKKTIMLTGDTKEVAEKTAMRLGIDSYRSELLPHQKVEQLEKLLSEQKGNKKIAYVGDGINDAPVLSRADLGIAMGGLGSDAAIEAADIVLMDDQPEKIVTAVWIARKTLKIVKQNIVFALLIKAAVLVLGAMGKANMWYAVFADVGVSVVAILNAMRALSVKKSH